MAAPYSPAEIQIIRDLYPDYPAMLRLLPDRKRKGLEYCAQEHGIATTRRPWTGPEIRKLTALCDQCLPWRKIAAAFPTRTMQSVKTFVRHNDLPYRRAYVPVDDSAMQAVRVRAAAVGMRLRELDRLAKCPAFFERARSPCLKHIAAGAAVLGGEVRIEWEPLD